VCTKKGDCTLQRRFGPRWGVKVGKGEKRGGYLGRKGDLENIEKVTSSK